MHTLFNFDFNASVGVVKVPEWIYLREQLLKSLTTFTGYYKDNTTAVKSDHLLVRLLQSITVSQSLGLTNYYSAVDAIDTRLSMSFDFTSSRNKGKLFNNVFYGPNSNEVIISVDVPFSTIYADANWRNVSAVRVLRHDRSGMAMNPLRGDDKYPNEISVLSINIPLLAIQYRAFRNYERSTKLDSDDSMRSAMQFVAMYVLPNMLASHLDLVILNRFHNLLLDKPNDAFTNHNPFYLTDFSNRVDTVLSELVNRFTTTKNRFEVVLKSIPTVSMDTAFDVMKVPSILPTRQVTWALVLSRLKTLESLFTISDISGSSENQSNMNKIIRHALFYRSDKSMSYGLTPSIYLDVQKSIDRLVSLAKQSE